MDEAFSLYQAIPDERRNGIKGIGFRLEDGSSYDGDYELMRGGVTSRDLIALVPHCQESPLVQKAIKDLNALLSSQQEQDHSAEKPAQREAGERQSVLQALRTRQAKQKAQEKSDEPKKAHTPREGEPEL